LGLSAYNLDLCARLAFVACPSCSVVVGYQFLQEPLLAQAGSGRWKGRLLLCRSLLLPQHPIAIAAAAAARNESDASAGSGPQQQRPGPVQCKRCDASLASADDALRRCDYLWSPSTPFHRTHGVAAQQQQPQQQPAGQRAGGVASLRRPAGYRAEPATSGAAPGAEPTTAGQRRLPATAGTLFARVNLGAVSLGRMQHHTLVQGEVLACSVMCARCDNEVGFVLRRIRSALHTPSLAFALGRVGLLHDRISGFTGATQGRNLRTIERIYQALLSVSPHLWQWAGGGAGGGGLAGLIGEDAGGARVPGEISSGEIDPGVADDEAEQQQARPPPMHVERMFLAEGEDEDEGEEEGEEVEASQGRPHGDSDDDDEEEGEDPDTMNPYGEGDFEPDAQSDESDESDDGA
jgi:hypothetical protein